MCQGTSGLRGCARTQPLPCSTLTRAPPNHRPASHLGTRFPHNRTHLGASSQTRPFCPTASSNCSARPSADSTAAGGRLRAGKRGGNAERRTEHLGRCEARCAPGIRLGAPAKRAISQRLTGRGMHRPQLGLAAAPARCSVGKQPAEADGFNPAQLGSASPSHLSSARACVVLTSIIMPPFKWAKPEACGTKPCGASLSGCHGQESS